MERVPSESEILPDAVTSPALGADDARPSAENGRENGRGNGSDTGIGHTPIVADDGSSLVPTPSTRRKPRAKKASTTTERPKRTSRKKIEPPATPVVHVPAAPLTRPDGTPGASPPRRARAHEDVR